MIGTAVVNGCLGGVAKRSHADPYHSLGSYLTAVALEPIAVSVEEITKEIHVGRKPSDLPSDYTIF